MKAKEFPYQKFQATPAWEVVEQAIGKLINNSDLVEKTDRRYIVGFILKELADKELLKTEA